jgi:hypothetical protein
VLGIGRTHGVFDLLGVLVRITFGWTEGDAIDVDLEDYH